MICTHIVNTFSSDSINGLFLFMCGGGGVWNLLLQVYVPRYLQRVADRDFQVG